MTYAEKAAAIFCGICFLLLVFAAATNKKN